MSRPCAPSPVRARRSPRSFIAGLLVLALSAVGPVVVTTTAQVPQPPTHEQDAPRESAGRILVVARDEQGGRLPGASVVLPGAAADANGPRVYVTDASGEAAIEVPPGDHRVLVELPGFETVTLAVVVAAGEMTRAEATLGVGRFTEQVAVRAEADVIQSPPSPDGQTEALSAREIEQLPDDPEELAVALQALAGAEADIRVNGFAGGDLPPKSQIQAVRIRRDPFGTDSMGAGQPRVEIITRPGSTAWTNEVSVGFRDQSLDARQPFAPERAEGRTRRLTWSFSGPLVKQRTSLSGRISARDAYDAQTIVARDSTTSFNEVVNREQWWVDGEARVEHAINTAQTLRGEYQRHDWSGDNLGVGEFELPERAFGEVRKWDLARLSLIGTIGKRFLNELRLEYVDSRSEVVSLSNALGINVPNAFRAGGAQRRGGRRDQEIEIADTLDLISNPRHKVRLGFETEIGWTRTDRFENFIGTYTFESLEAYDARRPRQFVQRTGDPLIEYDRAEVSWFVYDDIELRKGLRMGVGLRHDVQSLLDDYDNLAPRVSTAWTPGGEGPTTVTAGVGLFNEWYQPWVYEQSLLLDGVRQRDLIVRNPDFPNPYGGIGQVELPPPSIVREADDLDMTRTARMSVGVEHRFSPQVRLQVNAYGQRTADRLRSINANAPIAGLLPDPAYDRITEVQSTGRASYGGFDTSVRLSSEDGRSSGLVRYQYGQSWNDSDGPTSLPADSRDPDAEWGPASWDVRHRIFGFVRMELPHGLRANAWADILSGAPYTIRTGLDDNGDTVFTDRPAGVGRNTERGTWQQTLNLRLGWKPQFLGNAPSPAADGSAPRPVTPRGVEFYAQAWNVLNETNFTRFSGVMTSPYYLQPTAAAPARRFDFGTRVFF